MQIHELQRTHKNKTKKTIGRGGKRGKTSGRGHKGQLAHGGTPRPMMRDILKKIPKLRGYKTPSIKDAATVVNVSELEAVFQNGESVTPATLAEKGILKGAKKTLKNVKILGNGNLSKKLTVAKCAVSASALEKITAAGGSVEA